MSLLKAVSVAKSYGGRRVVSGISVEVKGGEIVGLLGPNGPRISSLMMFGPIA